jgi:uncharacterized protein (DUF1800 family)
MNEEKKMQQEMLKQRMQHALNGPTRPNLPQTSPFLVEDAEAEIRRSTQRHYAQIAEIAELKTDRDHWRNEAQLEKGEKERVETLFNSERKRLEARCADQEAHIGELMEAIAVMRTHMDTGVESYLKSYRVLKEIPHMKIVTPAALLSLEHADDEDKNEPPPSA